MMLDDRNLLRQTKLSRWFSFPHAAFFHQHLRLKGGNHRPSRDRKNAVTTSQSNVHHVSSEYDDEDANDATEERYQVLPLTAELHICTICRDDFGQSLPLILFVMRDYAAPQELDAAVKGMPHDPDALADMAEFLREQMRDLDQAEVFYKRAIESNPRCKLQHRQQEERPGGAPLLLFPSPLTPPPSIPPSTVPPGFGLSQMPSGRAHRPWDVTRSLGCDLCG
jgi:hypothetical protein